MSSRDEPKTGHSLDLDQDDLIELVECNLFKSTWEVIVQLNNAQSTICHHLKNIGENKQVGHLGSAYP